MKNINVGEKNGQWKGDKVSYKVLHTYMNRHLIKPKFCQRCKKVPPKDLANKGIYNREPNQWEFLCRKCHMVNDERLKKLIIRNKQGRIRDIICRVCNKKFHPRSINTKYCSRFCYFNFRFKRIHET